MEKIEAIKLHPDAILPTRAHAHDAGIDLYAFEDTPYRPGGVVLVSTRITFNISEGFVGLICDRSSVGKLRLKITGGVVDAGYRGDITVMLLNLSGEHGVVKRGQKIAQMLIMPVSTPQIVEGNAVTETARGTKGFGSSGT